MRTEVLKTNSLYKEGIVEIVEKIDKTDVLNYIYIVVSDIMKEVGNKENV